MGNNRQPQDHWEFNHYVREHAPVPCEELPDVFFPEDFTDRTMRTKAIEIAKKLCSECPIRLQCLNTAMMQREGYGIWGGLTPQERGYIGR